MAEQNGTTAVETSVVNPKQESQVIENFDKVSSSSTPIEELQNNLQKFKTEKIHNFTDSAAWADYKSNLFRALDSNKYPGFAAIEKVHDDPIWKANVEAYGDIIADRAQAISGTYKRANTWGGRLAGAYNEQRYGLRVAAARKDLSDAILEGDDLKIATARVRLEKEQKNQYERGMEYEKYGNTLMSISASVARNPETIPVEIAGAALAPVTYGISEGLARLINAGIVGADTYRLEAGSSLLQMDEEFPGMTEEQKHAGARKAGLANAAIEAGLMGAGVGVAGFGARTIGRAAASKGVEAAASSIAGKEIAKETFKTNFIKALQKPTKELTKGQKIAKTAADIGLNSIGEGLQEVFQDTITNAMLLSVRNGTPMTQEFLDDWADFVADPFNPAHADKWETFINVALASPILGVGFAAAGAGIRNIGSFKQKNTEHNGLGTISDKISGAVNNSLGLSQLFNWHKKADAKNGLGAANAVLKAQIDSGEISGKLYTTVEQVQQMQQDPEIAEALAQMGIAEAMENASENGGVVELDLLAYDKVVNESQNTTLFQKMRNYLSFSDTTMSAAEFNEFIRSNSALVAKQITDEVRNDANSAFSRMKETMLKAGKSEAEAEGNAAVFHVMMERLKTLNGKESDIENRLSVSVETGQGAVTMPNAAEVGFTQKTVDNVNQPANIQSETGARNEQTGNIITDTIKLARTESNLAGSGRPAVLYGRIWNDARAGTKGVEKAKGMRVLKLDKKTKDVFKKNGIDTSNLIILDGTVGDNARTFRSAILAAKKKLGAKAAAVDAKKVSEYKEMKTLILSEDRQTGVAVTEDGDVVSVFNANTNRAGGIYSLLVAAIENGGKKLDCFDTFLPKVYSRVGFRAVARNHWVENYKPTGWDKEYFSVFNNGEPDVVFMVYDPTYNQEYKRGDGELISTGDTDKDYGLGMTAQDEELARIAERDGATADVNVGGQTYYMKVKGEVEAGRTTAQDGKYQINLTKDANVVTFSHEMFHVFSLELQREYNNGTMTEYWKKQAEKMFKIVDAKPQPDPADPTVTRYFLTEAQEERLANMFTTYIMKGQIENKEIRGIMARMIDMFKAAYRQLDGRGLTALALNNKAKDFFNSVFNSQDQIEDIQRMVGLLEIPKPENVDQELYDYYIANMTASRVEAANDLRAKLFKIEEYRNSVEYEKKLQAFKEEAKEHLLDTEKYQILSWQNIFQGEDKAEKMLLKAQVEFPESNYTIGDINNILEKTEPLESASQQIAEDKMEADIAKRFNLTVKDLGFREERNKAKVRALIAESVMDRNGTLADVEEEVRRAEAAADKQLANMSVYQIMDMDKWKNREAAAVERYTWAKRNNKDELAAAERYNQAVLNLIMIKSNGFKSEYKKLTALFDKLQDRQKKYRRKDEFGKEYGELEHRYNAVDWELLRSISEQFGNKINDMRRSPKTVQQQLQDWIQTQVASRFTTVANLEQFVPFINRGTDGSVGAMKGKDFKKLWAVMHTIDSIAMREQELFLDGQYENMNKYAQQVVEFYQKMNIKTDEEKTSWYARHFGRYGSWQNPEPLLKAILPTEVFNKIFLPMFNNAIKAERYGQQWIRTWRGVKAKIDTSANPFVLDDGTTISYTRNEKTRTLSYADVADLLLAMGSNHSYENYKLKFGLSDEQAEMIASQALNRNKDYAEFLNTTWKVYGEATELLNNSFQERKNELFVRKDHRAFEINGIKFEGGYVPEDKHYLNLIRELGTINQGMKNNKNEKLIIKHADGDVLSITDITETKLSQSAKWAFAAIPYNNIQKFMQIPAVRNTMGERAFSFVQDWLQAYDTPHTDVSGMWRPLSQATTIAALGARASTALLQLSGLSQGWAKLGTTYMGRGMLRFIRNGEWVKPFKMAQGKSDYMAARVENPFSSLLGNASQGATLREIFNSYNAKTGLGKAGVALLSAWQRAAMFGIQLVDGYVSNVTWNGAYLRALDKGMSEADARLEADSLVRITQSDAMQISRSAAQQEPYARAVTAFATWLMAMRSETMAKTTSSKYTEDMVIWIASYAIFGTFMEACLQELVGPVDKDKEDKEVLERIFNSWYNKITESVGTYVMPFAGIGATGAKAIMAGFVNTDDEKIYEVFAGGNVSALQYAWNAIDTVKTTIEYAKGDEEKGEKALIKATGLVSYNLKKRIKNALEE